MKRRHGFVSNSSTSSFVVAVQKPKGNEPDWVDHIKSVILHSNTSFDDLRFFIRSPSEYVALLKEAKTEFEKDLEWLCQELALLGELESHTDRELLFRWIELMKKRSKLTLFNEKTTPFEDVRGRLERVRGQRFQYGRYPSPQEAIDAERDWVMHDRTNITEALEEIKTRLALAQTYEDAKWYFIGFTEDMYWGILEKIVQDLETKGVAKTIHQEAT